MHKPTRDDIVDLLVELIDRRGDESYLGEALSMREHMLQSAMLAEDAQAPPALVAAALLHDIGHYCGDFPEDALEHGTDNRHQEAGAALLAPFFPALTVECVRHHVAAKRYLCAVDSAYYEQLSRASVTSLALQGGPMSVAERDAFAARADVESVCAVRRWDDAAKRPGLSTPPVAHYRPVLTSLVDATTA